MALKVKKKEIINMLITIFLLFLPTQLLAQAGVHEYFDWGNASPGSGTMGFGVTIFTIGGWILSTYYLHKKFDVVGFIIGFFFWCPVKHDLIHQTIWLN